MSTILMRHVAMKKVYISHLLNDNAFSVIKLDFIGPTSRYLKFLIAPEICYRKSEHSVNKML